MVRISRVLVLSSKELGTIGAQGFSPFPSRRYRCTCGTGGERCSLVRGKCCGLACPVLPFRFFFYQLSTRIKRLFSSPCFFKKKGRFIPRLSISTIPCIYVCISACAPAQIIRCACTRVYVCIYDLKPTKLRVFLSHFWIP